MPKGSRNGKPSVTVGGYGEWANVRRGQTELNMSEISGGTANVRAGIRTVVGDRVAGKLLNKASVAGYAQYPSAAPTSRSMARGKSGLPKKKK